MAKKGEIEMQEHWKMHKKKMAWKMLILGALILANSYWQVFTWVNFIGWIIVIAGIVKLCKPACSCGK